MLGSGAILNETIKAQKILEEDYAVAADVWSVTSYKELYQDSVECERWNLLNPSEPQRTPYVAELLASRVGPFVAASDYVRNVPEQIRQWVPGRFVVLGTDGYGRSDAREALRHHFEVDRRFIVLATLRALADEGVVPRSLLAEAISTLGIDVNKPNPLNS